MGRQRRSKTNKNIHSNSIGVKNQILSNRLNSDQVGVIILYVESPLFSNHDGLKTVESCICVTHEPSSKPGFEVKQRKGFLRRVNFVIRLTLVVIALAFLSCILAVLNCMSVFVVSTALDDLPVSEILLAQG